MRAIVCGGRDYTDAEHVFQTLDALRKTMGLAHVIEGGQRRRNPQNKRIDGGADYWAMRWAKARGLTWDTVEADWKTHGRAAGPLRNAKMLAEYRPEITIAFPGGRGTQDMIDRTERARLQALRIKPRPAKFTINGEDGKLLWQAVIDSSKHQYDL